VKEAEKQLAAGNQDLEKTRQAIDASAASLRSDIERLEASLVASEAALPADFKVDYQRVVRGKGANGLAAVDENVCGACGQQITLNMQNELRLSRAVFCKSCGCLLYLSE
jgi:uncharacterized protein